ncbi:gp53-like domain-containing protein [Citrobacter tructae]|uniref:gp53-like domain-containing protein n=1 Tax=Citrobacter tructae TaxID=2562449 RepID=UPI003F57DABA
MAVATFPVPFPTECLTVQIGEVTSTQTGNSGVKSWGVSLDTLTKTGVSGVMDVTGSPATGEFFIYRAIGR